MGLLQKAVETYDSHLNYASQNREGQSRMAPVGHIVTRAELEITLDADGKFINARAVDKSEPKIIIPATESSAGRTSAPCAHPLCDQIGYLIPQNEKKFRLYVDQLSDWEASVYTHPKLTAVLNYVKGKTILPDLLRCGLVKVNEKGMPEKEDALVRWRIWGDPTDACWMDQRLIESFINYYSVSRKTETALCMVSGKQIPTATQHPNGIIPKHYLAKLVSSNDKNNFTYRGRFTTDTQALTISYEASQKAHNALRWLIETQGVTEHYGDRFFLCWNPEGRLIPQPSLPFMPPAPPVFRPSEYKATLEKVLYDRQKELKLTDGVVLAIFDAATKGRLALTYYNELQAHDFLERLHDWDASCCWPHRYWGISSPRLSQIVHYAFGTQRAEKGQFKMIADNQILAQQMQRLIACRVDKVAIDLDIVKSLVERASNLNIYKCYDTDSQQREDIRENLLFVTCAVIRKYRMNRYKEEWEMSLNPTKMDRSYQFGRLMAIFEQIERAVSYKNGLEHKTSYTIRHQNAFRNKPLTTTEDIHRHLRDAYLPRLSTRSQDYYQNLIGEVIEMLSHFPEADMDLKLSETYLLGYYLQRSDMMPKKQHKDEQEEEV